MGPQALQALPLKALLLLNKGAARNSSSSQYSMRLELSCPRPPAHGRLENSSVGTSRTFSQLHYLSVASAHEPGSKFVAWSCCWLDTQCSAHHWICDSARLVQYATFA